MEKIKFAQNSASIIIDMNFDNELQTTWKERVAQMKFSQGERLIVNLINYFDNNKHKYIIQEEKKKKKKKNILKFDQARNYG